MPPGLVRIPTGIAYVYMRTNECTRAHHATIPGIFTKVVVGFVALRALQLLRGHAWPATGELLEWTLLHKRVGSCGSEES